MKKCLSLFLRFDSTDCELTNRVRDARNICDTQDPQPEPYDRVRRVENADKTPKKSSLDKTDVKRFVARSVQAVRGQGNPFKKGSQKTLMVFAVETRIYGINLATHLLHNCIHTMKMTPT